RGSKNRRILDFGLDKVSTYSIMKDYSEDSVKEMIMTLVAKDYIHITADKFPVLRLTSKSKDVLSGSTTVYHKKDLIEKSSVKNNIHSNIEIPESFNEELFLELKEL